MRCEELPLLHSKSLSLRWHPKTKVTRRRVTYIRVQHHGELNRTCNHLSSEVYGVTFDEQMRTGDMREGKRDLYQNRYIFKRTENKS
jgi:hypothetical protein